MSIGASTPTNLPEPSPPPPDSQVFTAPCVQEENQQGKFGFFDITLLSPLCPPSSPAPSWPPFAPPSHLQSYVRKALSESGKSVLLRVRKDPRCLSAPPCPAQPPALRAVAPPWAAGSLLAHALSCDVAAQGVYMFCTSAGDCT